MYIYIYLLEKCQFTTLNNISNNSKFYRKGQENKPKPGVTHRHFK